MPLEIPCPQCGAILRAPDNSAGRKARCKKCQHAFRLAGEPPADNTAAADESQSLSVVSFQFDGPAEPRPAQEKTKSKAKYGSSIKADGRKPTKPADNRRLVMILTFVLVAALLGVGGYFLATADKPVAQASSAAKPMEPARESVREPAKPEKKKDDVKPAERKSEPTADKRIELKAEKKAKPIPVLTGGYKLPDPPAKAEKLNKFPKRISVETPNESVRGLYMPAGEMPLFGVLTAGDPGFGGEGAKDRFDRYNSDTGALVDRTEIDAGGGNWPRAAALSPGGDRFASEGAAGVVSIYGLNERARIGEPIRPFGDKPIPLAGVYFIDESTLLIVAADGRLETWADGAKKAEGNIGGAVSASSISLWPNREGLVAAVGGNLVKVGAKSLRATEGMALPKSPGEVYSIAAGSGDRVAVAYQATSPGLHNVIFIGREGDAKPTILHFDNSYGIPQQISWNGADSLTFVSSREAAVSVEMFEVRRPLAVLWPQDIKPRQILAHGKHYVWLTDPTDAKRTLIAEVDFPPDEVLKLANEERESKKPAVFLLNAEGHGR